MSRERGNPTPTQPGEKFGAHSLEDSCEPIDYRPLGKRLRTFFDRLKEQIPYSISSAAKRDLTMANRAYGLLNMVGDNPVSLKNFLPGTTFDPNDFEVNTIVKINRERFIVDRTIFEAPLYILENGKVVKLSQNVRLEPQTSGRESWVMGGVVVRKVNTGKNDLIAFTVPEEGKAIALLFPDPIRVGQWDHSSVILPTPLPYQGLKHDIFSQVTKIEVLRYGVPEQEVERSLQGLPKLVLRPLGS